MEGEKMKKKTTTVHTEIDDWWWICWADASGDVVKGLTMVGPCLWMGVVNLVAHHHSGGDRVRKHSVGIIGDNLLVLNQLLK